jgi:hypothetical protein
MLTGALFGALMALLSRPLGHGIVRPAMPPTGTVHEHCDQIRR